VSVVDADSSPVAPLKRFTATSNRFRQAAGRANVLDERTAALVWLALAAHVGLLHPDGIREHAERAAAAGASLNEMAEVLTLATAIGAETLAVGMTALLRQAPDLAGGEDAAPLSEEHQHLRDAFARSGGRPGPWSPIWRAALRLDPDYFAALVDLLDTPWTVDVLDARARALVRVALSVTGPHPSPESVGQRISAALTDGCTPPEVFEAMRIASAVPQLSLVVGLPIVKGAAGSRSADGPRSRSDP